MYLYADPFRDLKVMYEANEELNVDQMERNQKFYILS